MQGVAEIESEKGADGLSRRQQEVLDVVLSLLAEGRESVTMSAVAQRASCSKETLYKWFGDRDGLLTATVRWQASKVAAGSFDRTQLDISTLQASLEAFAATWLEVISSQTSIALNRVAISHAGSGKSNLGEIVLANGRFALGERLKPLLLAAKDARLLDFGDAETAFRTFFGLVARDVHIRILLGDDSALSRREIARDAKCATDQFMRLYRSARKRASAKS